MPKATKAPEAETASAEQTSAVMVEDRPPVSDERDARIAELEAKLDAQNEALTEVLKELKKNRPLVPEGPKEYVWPVQAKEQAQRSAPQIPTTRVIKIGYLDPDRRFAGVDPEGKPVVKIGQYRVPMAEKKFDENRMRQEFHKFGLAPLEDVFEDAPILCQLKDCWRPATFDGAFCHIKHREFVLGAHDRYLVLE